MKIFSMRFLLSEKKQIFFKSLIEKCFLPASLAFICCFVSDILNINSLFFDFSNKYFHKENIILIKILYFCFLFVFFGFNFFLYKKIKEKNVLYKRGIKIFLIYFSLIFMILLSIWPGFWTYDDMCILCSDFELRLNSWHHILTSLFHFTFLQLLPFPAGIIIFQNIIIAALASFSEGLFPASAKSFCIFSRILSFFVISGSSL